MRRVIDAYCQDLICRKPLKWNDELIINKLISFAKNSARDRTNEMVEICKRKTMIVGFDSSSEYLTRKLKVVKAKGKTQNWQL